jgi:pseudouridine-5'-phosphate glycosidase
MGYEVGVAPAIRIADEVRAALGEGRPVVALETSVVAHGLPPPHGMEASRICAAAVRAAGAVPAVVAVLAGELVVGAGEGEVERLAAPGRNVAKAGARDLGALLASGADAGTTVSATCAAAALSGIRVVATGGIGGVHRAGARGAWDVSADLAEIARAPVCVVSSGPKAILDVPATAEVLETLGVPVVGLGTFDLPAFWSASSGVRVAHRVDDAAAAARLLSAHWDLLGRREGVLLAVPPPEPIDREEVERAIEVAEADAARLGVGGPARTPHVLSAVARATGGRTLRANLALLERNAAVAGAVAAALAAGRGR